MDTVYTVYTVYTLSTVYQQVSGEGGEHIGHCLLGRVEKLIIQVCWSLSTS